MTVYRRIELSRRQVHVPSDTRAPQGARGRSGPHRLRPSLADPVRGRARRDDGRPGRDGRLHRQPGDRPGPPRRPRRSAVGHQRLPARPRRHADPGGEDRRPVRAQAHVPGRGDRLRRGVPDGRALRRHRHGHLLAGRPGCRGGAPATGQPRDHPQHLPGAPAQRGDRHLGRHGRHLDRRRPDRRRTPGPARQLAVGLLPQRTARPARPARRPVGRSASRGTRERADRSTSPASPCCQDRCSRWSGA